MEELLMKASKDSYVWFNRKQQQKNQVAKAYDTKTHKLSHCISANKAENTTGNSPGYMRTVDGREMGNFRIHKEIQLQFTWKSG